jgi:hypothetical protein
MGEKSISCVRACVRSIVGQGERRIRILVG